MAIDISQFSQIFFEETEELLADLEKYLLAVDLDAPDLEMINAIFRIAHSIKGGAATFGFGELIEITHILESMLDNIRQGQDRFTLQHQDILLQSGDVLKMQLDSIRFNAPVDAEKVAEVKNTLIRMLDHPAAPASSPDVAIIDEKESSVSIRYFQIKISGLSDADGQLLSQELALLGDIKQLGSDSDSSQFELATNETEDDILALCGFVVDPMLVEISQITNNPVADDSEALGYGFFDLPEPKPEIVAHQVPKLSPTANLPASKTDLPVFNVEASTIRVSIEKVDQLINLVGELIITQAMIAKRSETIDKVLHEKLLNGIGQFGQNSRDLQEIALSMRMLPMEVVFSRFPRMVRELAAKLGKKIDLITEGSNIELDKGLIEKIVDPLTHLVRNSVDHGIELPALREQKAKPQAGRLSLSAVHQGGHVLIQVQDDGAGLDRQKILRKAISEGLTVRDDLSDEEVWQLIFHPGFSTAEVVTDVSGRGVGMDVVKRNINSLGGTITIHSKAGLGTTMTVSLPLTLVILDGMSVKVGNEIYVLPLNAVVESFQPQARELKTISGHGQLVYVRGEYLPILSLADVFSVPGAVQNFEQGILVVIAVEGRKAALWVDQLLGQQQIVVKNIESNYRKVANIAGATIMGDGSVSLIVDLSELIRTYCNYSNFSSNAYPVKQLSLSA